LCDILEHSPNLISDIYALYDGSSTHRGTNITELALNRNRISNIIKMNSFSNSQLGVFNFTGWQ